MPTNIFGGRPNACIATTTQTFASMGLDVTNVFVIYEVGATLKSWMPDRAINAITGQIAGNGYYFVARIDVDLTAFLAPPTTSLPPLVEILLTASLQNVLDNGNVSTTGFTIGDEAGRNTVVGDRDVAISDADGIVLGLQVLTVGPSVNYYLTLKDVVGGRLARVKAGQLIGGIDMTFTTPIHRAGQLALAGNGIAPAQAAGTGAGTSPTISFSANSDDNSGVITVLTGSSPAGSNATIVTVTFHSSYPASTNVRVCLTPANAAAAALSGTTQVYVDGSAVTAIFLIKSGSAALTGATTYKWNYIVMQ